MTLQIVTRCKPKFRHRRKFSMTHPRLIPTSAPPSVPPEDNPRSRKTPSIILQVLVRAEGEREQFEPVGVRADL